jgi:hypothetical protein
MTHIIVGWEELEGAIVQFDVRAQDSRRPGSNCPLAPLHPSPPLINCSLRKVRRCPKIKGIKKSLFAYLVASLSLGAMVFGTTPFNDVVNNDVVDNAGSV